MRHTLIDMHKLTIHLSAGTLQEATAIATHSFCAKSTHILDVGMRIFVCVGAAMPALGMNVALSQVRVNVSVNMHCRRSPHTLNSHLYPQKNRGRARRITLILQPSQAQSYLERGNGQDPTQAPLPTAYQRPEWASLHRLTTGCEV
jgi:hypothetical protein